MGGSDKVAPDDINIKFFKRDYDSYTKTFKIIRKQMTFMTDDAADMENL
jgi:hypothetical protein